jgi:hypothetical protein
MSTLLIAIVNAMSYLRAGQPEQDTSQREGTYRNEDKNSERMSTRRRPDRYYTGVTRAIHYYTALEV